MTNKCFDITNLRNSNQKNHSKNAVKHKSDREKSVERYLCYWDEKKGKIDYFLFSISLAEFFFCQELSMETQKNFVGQLTNGCMFNVLRGTSKSDYVIGWIYCEVFEGTDFVIFNHFQLGVKRSKRQNRPQINFCCDVNCTTNHQIVAKETFLKVRW